MSRSGASGSRNSIIPVIFSVANCDSGLLIPAKGRHTRLPAFKEFFNISGTNRSGTHVESSLLDL